VLRELIGADNDILLRAIIIGVGEISWHVGILLDYIQLQ
jgi:hypothetical protein